jgi:hypothetical protein
MRTLCVAVLVCFLASCAAAPQDELSARKMMEKLEKVPECRAYLRSAMEPIHMPAYEASSLPHDFVVVVRFKLHADGSVSDLAATQNTNSPVAPLCLRVIKDRSPFPKWPSKMRSVVGQDYFEIYYRFGWNMTPPSAD